MQVWIFSTKLNTQSPYVILITRAQIQKLEIQNNICFYRTF